MLEVLLKNSMIVTVMMSVGCNVASVDTTQCILTFTTGARGNLTVSTPNGLLWYAGESGLSDTFVVAKGAELKATRRRDGNTWYLGNTVTENLHWRIQ